MEDWMGKNLLGWWMLAASLDLLVEGGKWFDSQGFWCISAAGREVKGGLFACLLTFKEKN